MQARRLAATLLGAALGVALALWLWNGDGGPGPAGPDPGQTESEPPGPPPARVVDAPQAAEIAIASGGTIEIDSRSLEPGRPVVVRLDLGVPSTTDEPRPVRLIGPGGFVRHGEGALGEGRGSARYEIDPAWLTPGRYVIEVKTTELSHFPLRRYAVEVK
jgi:hypothetical protein